jgi:adenylosuccinate lyase
LRRAGVDRPYELLKDLTRTGGHMTQENLEKFIEALEVSAEVKAELKAITPFSFIGVVPCTNSNNK